MKADELTEYEKEKIRDFVNGMTKKELAVLKKAIDERIKKRTHKLEFERKNMRSIIIAICLSFVIVTIPVNQGVPIDQPDAKKYVYTDKIEQSISEIKNIKETDLYNTELPEEIEQYAIDICKSYDLPPEIVFGVISRESKYDIGAIGDKGQSLGLMQIQPKWHRERMNRLGCDDLLDPYQNILVGVDFLSELKNKYGDIDSVLSYYNSGSISKSREYACKVKEEAHYVITNN